jgi:hypothetical protein
MFARGSGLMTTNQNSIRDLFSIACVVVPLLMSMPWEIPSKTSGGTLVVMVPTSTGLVIAADSRITIGGNLGLHCDNNFKITEIDHANRTAVVVTGYTTVWDFQNVPVGDICTYIRDVPARFDINVILKDAIEQTPSIVSNAIYALPKVCIDAINRYSVGSPGDFASRRGAQIFQVAVASYDDVRGISKLRDQYGK